MFLDETCDFSTTLVFQHRLWDLFQFFVYIGKTTDGQYYNITLGYTVAYRSDFRSYDENFGLDLLPGKVF